MHGWSHLTALLLAVGGSPPPTAPPVDLTYEAEPGCPSRERLLEQVAGYLANRTVPRGQVEALVRARPAAGGWEITIVIEQGQGSGSRTLTAQTCEAAADAAALVLAIAVAPTEPTTDEPPAFVPEPVVPAAVPDAPVADSSGTVGDVAATPAPPPLATTRSRPRSKPGAWIGQFEFRTAVVGWALPGNVTGLGMIGAALRHRRVAIELGGAIAVPTTVRRDPLRATYRFGTGLLAICPVVWSSSRVDLPICLSTEVGRLRAEGDGGINHTPRRHLWVASALGPGLWWWPHRNVGLTARIELMVPWLRRSFVIAERDMTRERDMGRIAPAGARVQLGLVVRTRPLLEK